jgi:glutathione S-transferase
VVRSSSTWTSSLTPSPADPCDRYLCDNYDLEHRLIPKDPALRARTQIFVHAAEGTLALHAIALFRFHSSIQTITHSSPEAVAAAETSMAASIQEDLDWLESELAASTGSFLVGGTPTAADVMTMFSVQILYKFKMGIDGSKSWPKVEAWLKACEGTASYKRAVERSGFVL